MDEKYMLDKHVKNEPLELKPAYPNLIPIFTFPISEKDATICVVFRRYLGSFVYLTVPPSPLIQHMQIHK